MKFVNCIFVWFRVIIFTFLVAGKPFAAYSQTIDLIGSLGYGLPMVGQKNVAIKETQEASGTQQSFEQKTISYASGFHAYVGVAYWFKPTWAIQLDGWYSRGNKQLSQKHEINQLTTGNYLFSSESYQLNMVRIHPSIVTRVPCGKGFIQFKTGALFNVYAWGNQYLEENSRISGNTFQWYMQSNIKGRVNIGYANGLSYHYPVAANLFAFLSADFLFQGLSLKSKWVETYTENGQNSLGKLTYAQRKTIYEKSAFHTNTSNTTNATQATATTLPFSCLTFQAGFRYRFEPKKF